MKNLINHPHSVVLLENTTKEELEVIKAFCIKHNFRSVREFTVFALNEVMLYMEADHGSN